MRTKTNLFLLLAIVLFVCSCGEDAQLKSRVKDAIAQQLTKNNNDITVKVFQFGKPYPCVQGKELETYKSEITSKFGEDALGDMKANLLALHLALSFSDGHIDLITHHIEENAKIIKDCGITTNLRFITCHVTTTSKLYNKKTERVYGVLYNIETDKLVGLIRDPDFI